MQLTVANSSNKKKHGKIAAKTTTIPIHLQIHTCIYQSSHCAHRRKSMFYVKFEFYSIVVNLSTFGILANYIILSSDPL